ncbi:DUF294 nucleotidyltransferase-like domain-containing protein [Bacillus salacetis]|uniref:DUF294 nucleotidyltransferase-like domain-containing protein n=1 Tax=Bacillus salacetis TaxID=2315464 RepID=UPI003BA09CB0
MTMQQSANNEKWKQAVLLHPLLSGMERGAALSLIDKGRIEEFNAGETFLYSGERRTGIYLILEGKAEVFVERESGRQEVLELIDKGEAVGLSSIHQLFSEGEEASTVNVKAVETSILFFIEFNSLKAYLPQVTDYLLNITAHRLQDVYQSLSHQLKIGERFPSNMTVFERMGDLIRRPPVCIEANHSLGEAARQMGKEKVGSLVVMEGESLAGLITERDLVRHAFAEGRGPGIKVSEIMNAKPPIIEAEEYYYEGLAKLLSGQSKYLLVQEREKVTGVVTLKDCMRRSNEGALLSFNEVEDLDYPVEKLSELSAGLSAFLWRSSTPVFRSMEMMTSLHDRIYKRMIRQVESEFKEETSGGYCFYVMGSAGRREQFFMSDQDHFLVYEKKEDQAYYSTFAQRLAERLVQAGFSRCAGNMMASNPQWRGDLLQWEEMIRKWSVHSDEQTLLGAHNFFAYRLLAGSPALHHAFERMAAEQLQRGKIFLYRMAQSIKAVPELNSSIRSFLGMTRKEIDLKKEILFPFHHSLQVLHLSHGGRSGSVLEKMSYLKDKQVYSSDFHEELLLAFHDLFKLLVDYKSKHPETGSKLSLHSLSTMQKERLYYSVEKIKEF